jgi:hypothetical protein
MIPGISFFGGMGEKPYSGGAQLLKPPVRRALCVAFSCLPILSPGHRDMGFNWYREALIVSIRAEGCQDVVA